LQEVLADQTQPVTAVLEASYHWGPVHDWLEEVAHEVVLAHPETMRR
jgi:hypothetical protein